MTWEPVVLDAAPELAFYEPWHPQIGQQVRVRLSGECQFTYPLEYTDARLVYHWPQLDGAIGTVIEPQRHEHECHESHRYAVEFRSRVLIEAGDIPHYCAAQCFAAIELEPA